MGGRSETTDSEIETHSNITPTCCSARLLRDPIGEAQNHTQDVQSEASLVAPLVRNDFLGWLLLLEASAVFPSARRSFGLDCSTGYGSTNHGSIVRCTGSFLPFAAIVAKSGAPLIMSQLDLGDTGRI
eukprot:4625383-Amphidinium_carterae.1